MIEMVRRWTLVAATLAATAVPMLFGISADAAPDWLQFRHPNYGFSISYPRGWKARHWRFGFEAVGPEVAGVPDLRLALIVETPAIASDAPLQRAGDGMVVYLTRHTSAHRIHRRERIDLGGIPALMIHLAVKSKPDGIELYYPAMVLTYRGQGYAVMGVTATVSQRLAEETRLLEDLILTFRPR